MDQFDLAATALTARVAAPQDFIALSGQPISTATISPTLEVRPTTRPEEPQSLTLALIGAATLLAYRGIKRRLGAHVAPSRPVLAAPRRAA